MSIYRRKHRGKRSRFYTAEFVYRGKVIRKAGLIDRESAQHWINTELGRLRRGAVGYVKPLLKSQVAPIINAWTDSLRAKGRDDMYCYTAGKRLNRLASECNWVTLGDVTRESLESWQSGKSLWRGKAIGNRTKNQFVETAIEWGKWLANPKQAKLPANPLLGIDLLSAKVNQSYRRAGTMDELNALLSTCPPDHRLFYLFEIYHPLRRDTVQQLTWRMLHLDGAPPWGLTPPEINKSRKPYKFPVRYDVAAELRKAKAERKAKLDDLVFPDAPTIDDLKTDLAAAKVDFCDDKGLRRLDLHAMRKTLIRLCKLSGVSLDAASLLLGHKNIATTKKSYDDDAVDPIITDVLEKLPAIGQVRVA